MCKDLSESLFLMNAGKLAKDFQRKSKTQAAKLDFD